jgi:hypothetical protein
MGQPALLHYRESGDRKRKDLRQRFASDFLHNCFLNENNFGHSILWLRGNQFFLFYCP